MSKDLERAVGASPGRRPSAAANAARGYFGVPVLDELLPGGIGYASQVMVLGDTGVGKSILAAHFLYEGLLVGDACVYVACDEPPDNMRQNMANLRLGTLAYEREGRLAFLDAFARERSNERRSVVEPNDLEEYFAQERDVIDNMRGTAVRLVTDSLSTVLGTKPRGEVLEFVRARIRYLGSRTMLVVDNYVTGLLDEQTVAGISHAYPLILKLGFEDHGNGLQRYLQLGKMRSGMFSGERRRFRIDPHSGIVAQR